jgi:hypothetical protein
MKIWTEEAGFHGHRILKRRVVRPMRNCFYVRDLLGIVFSKVPNCSYKALRLLVWPVAKAPERKWGSQKTID